MGYLILILCVFAIFIFVIVSTDGKKPPALKHEQQNYKNHANRLKNVESTEVLEVELSSRQRIINDSLRLITTTNNLAVLRGRYLTLEEHIGWIKAKQTEGYSITTSQTPDSFIYTLKGVFNDNVIRLLSYHFEKYLTDIRALKTDNAKKDRQVKIALFLGDCITSLKPHENLASTKETIKTLAEEYDIDLESDSTHKARKDIINREYRTSDQSRWEGADYIVGYEIRRSNNCRLSCEICNVGAGRFPKTFKWSGWHDGCKCYTISILKTPEEMDADTQKILSGDPIDNQSTNKVNDVSRNFKTYINSNKSICQNMDWYINNKELL